MRELEYFFSSLALTASAIHFAPSMRPPNTEGFELIDPFGVILYSSPIRLPGTSAIVALEGELTYFSSKNKINIAIFFFIDLDAASGHIFLVAYTELKSAPHFLKMFIFRVSNEIRW